MLKFYRLSVLCVFILISFSFAKKKKSEKSLVAISIKQLALIESINIESDTFNLFDISSIKGLLLGEDDMIIVAEKDEEPVDLCIDDLVSLVKYYKSEDSILTCEIKMNSDEIQTWNNFLGNLNKRGDTPILKMISKWQQDKGCGEIEINGVPFNSHLSKTLINADVLLKKFAYDKEKIRVKKLKNYLEILYPKVQKGLERNAFNLGTISHSFWLYNGNVNIQKEDSSFFINDYVIRLYTSGEKRVYKGNVSYDTTKSINKFVGNFNEKISEVILRAQEFKTLNELSKIHLLLSIHKSEFIKIFNLSKEFKSYDNPRVFKTIRSYNYFEADSDITPQGTGITNYSYMYYYVFGGIDMSTNNVKYSALDEMSKQIKKVVLKSRPTADAVMWEIRL